VSREYFEAWAPVKSEWSQWAKPAPFIDSAMASAPDATPGPDLDTSTMNPERELCIVLDLPGPESIRTAVALARKGFQPVPLINTTTGNSEGIRMGEVLCEFRWGAIALREIAIPEEALPAFVLDSRREGAGYFPGPNTYDNRWMVFPQDFPSGNYMAARGVRRALVLTRERGLRPDIQHVLRRWQEAGIKIFLETPGDGQKPAEVTIEKPSMFKLGWYRFLVAIGMKRNAAGGFGGWIPEPSQSGGYG
jgi:hypothetical protein